MERNLKFIFASDSFKGSLSSKEAAELLTKAAKAVFPECICVGVPVADGGEGTVDAVVSAAGGEMRPVTVCGPLLEKAEIFYGVLPGGRAIIEMAAASGLPMVPEKKRNPLYTTTYGTGELIFDALKSGYRDITVAIGGSATNDGGMGALRALGVKFLDADGNELSGIGEDLEKVEKISMDGLIPEAKEARFTVMCDVTNPLTGKQGATYTFGKQKGGTPKILDRLEAGMIRYADKLEEAAGKSVRDIPGAGAAGGLGAALLAVLDARLQSGIETVLDLIDFDTLLDGADLVVTGEGRIDWQSAFGKVPGGVAGRAKKRGIPAAALVGGAGPGSESLYHYGIDTILAITDGPMDLKEAMDHAAELYEKAAERMFRMLRIGLEIEERRR